MNTLPAVLFTLLFNSMHYSLGLTLLSARFSYEMLIGTVENNLT